ncbi:MAG: hypothetical protein WCL02_03345 [bacterium]
MVPSSKDYTQINRPEPDQENEDTYNKIPISQNQTGHFAADNEPSINTICESLSICDKINFKGDFSNNDKYEYIKSFSKIIKFIDTNSNEDKNIEDVITDIEISNENGKRRGYATRNTILFNI